MLRLTAQLAQPLEAATANTCVGGKARVPLAIRSFSSTLLGREKGSDGGLDHIKDDGKREAEVYEGGHRGRRKFWLRCGRNERWPSVTRGYNLGKAVNQLRTRLEKSPLSTELKEELEKLDFVRNASQYKWDNIVLPALQRFHQVHRHTDVPQEFVVPTNDETWPRLARGYQLGKMVNCIRRKESYTAQVAMSKDELDGIEFCYDMSIAERDWTKKILPSFQVYRQEFGDCIIPTAFVVPVSSPWPEKAWGMPLGKVVDDIRQKQCYTEQTTRDRPVLDALGFAWRHHDAVWNEVIIPALETYVGLFKNDNVPKKFVVPSEAPWPERAWGKRLGGTLSTIRLRGSYFGQYGRDIKHLDELGLNLKLSSRTWKKRVVPLLSMYAELHGEEEIPRDFVIPLEALWEEKLWGVRLGLIVARNPQFASRE